MKSRLRKRHLSSTKKVTSMLTNCYICDEKTSKSNYHDGVCLCNKCKQLASGEMYSKLVENIRDVLIDDPIFDNKEVLKSLIKNDD